MCACARAHVCVGLHKQIRYAALERKMAYTRNHDITYTEHILLDYYAVALIYKLKMRFNAIQPIIDFDSFPQRNKHPTTAHVSSYSRVMDCNGAEKECKSTLQTGRPTHRQSTTGIPEKWNQSYSPEEIAHKSRKIEKRTLGHFRESFCFHSRAGIQLKKGKKTIFKRNRQK